MVYLYPCLSRSLLSQRRTRLNSDTHKHLSTQKQTHSLEHRHKRTAFKTNTQQSVPLLTLPAGPPCLLSPRPSPLSTRLVPTPVWLNTSLGSSIVVHHFHSRVSADLKYFSALHCAGVDEDDLPCRGLPKPNPLSTNHLSTITFTTFE